MCVRILNTLYVTNGLTGIIVPDAVLAAPASTSTPAPLTVQVELSEVPSAPSMTLTIHGVSGSQRTISLCQRNHLRSSCNDNLGPWVSNLHHQRTLYRTQTTPSHSSDEDISVGAPSPSQHLYPYSSDDFLLQAFPASSTNSAAVFTRSKTTSYEG